MQKAEFESVLKSLPVLGDWSTRLAKTCVVLPWTNTPIWLGPCLVGAGTASDLVSELTGTARCTTHEAVLEVEIASSRAEGHDSGGHTWDVYEDKRFFIVRVDTDAFRCVGETRWTAGNVDTPEHQGFLPSGAWETIRRNTALRVFCKSCNTVITSDVKDVLTHISSADDFNCPKCGQARKLEWDLFGLRGAHGALASIGPEVISPLLGSVAKIDPVWPGRAVPDILEVLTTIRTRESACATLVLFSGDIRASGFDKDDGRSGWDALLKFGPSAIGPQSLWWLAHQKSLRSVFIFDSYVEKLSEFNSVLFPYLQSAVPELVTLLAKEHHAMGTRSAAASPRNNALSFLESLRPLDDICAAPPNNREVALLESVAKHQSISRYWAYLSEMFLSREQAYSLVEAIAQSNADLLCHLCRSSVWALDYVRRTQPDRMKTLLETTETVNPAQRLYELACVWSDDHYVPGEACLTSAQLAMISPKRIRREGNKDAKTEAFLHTIQIIAHESRAELADGLKAIYPDLAEYSDYYKTYSPTRTGWALKGIVDASNLLKDVRSVLCEAIPSAGPETLPGITVMLQELGDMECAVRLEKPPLKMRLFHRKLARVAESAGKSLRGKLSYAAK